MAIAISAIVAALAPSSALACGSKVKVAVFVGSGANSDKIAATLRACQACGFDFYGIARGDITQGRLTTAGYDVLLLPAGQEDTTDSYCNTSWGLGDSAAIDAIRTFVSSGGGVVGIESGAAFLAQNGPLQIYSGDYQRTGTAGKDWLSYTDGRFGSGRQQLYRTAGGGYLDVPDSATKVAQDTHGNAVIARQDYGDGRVIVCTLEPELRGDSELDWSIWDNWEMGNRQFDSVGGWKLLGRMVNWAGTGRSWEPRIRSHPNPKHCPRIAVASTYVADGGAWPGLLPAVNRACQYSRCLPLAVRLSDIVDGRLTRRCFDAALLPGGYCYGYETELGTVGGQNLKDFVSSGGGLLAICAGTYYLSREIDYYGEHCYYLDIFKGLTNGELWDIAWYPHAALTPTYTDDAVIGDFGTLQMYYGGGPYFTDLEASDATSVTTYSYDGLYAGTTDAMRFTYGAGHVMMVGTHPEVRNGSNVDWMTWDNYLEGTNTPWVNPDNTWPYFSALLNRWVCAD